MRNLSFIALFSAIIGFVVAFFKEFVFPEKRIDHSGLQSFTEKANSIAVEVSLKLHAWLSRLQHSPTV